MERMEYVNDRNTHPDFKHIMRVTESEEYFKHWVAVSNNGICSKNLNLFRVFYTIEKCVWQP